MTLLRATLLTFKNVLAISTGMRRANKLNVKRRKGIVKVRAVPVQLKRGKPREKSTKLEYFSLKKINERDKLLARLKEKRHKHKYQE